jgi:proline iminopeptidase
MVTADDGCRLWTEATGDGPPLVLCHGGPGLWDYFADLAGLLGGLGRRIVRWDQRGCGRSERRGPYTVARFVADLDAVRGDGTIALLGHSWGARLALRYALDHPDRVDRLVYVAGTGIDPGDAWRPVFRQTMARLLDGPEPADEREAAIRQWATDFADPQTAREQAAKMARPWFGINWECSRALNTERDPGLESRCRGLAIPVLIVEGDRDLRPRWAVDSLAAALPDVRRLTFTGAGHLPWVEEPDGFRRAVGGFLA